MDFGSLYQDINGKQVGKYTEAVERIARRKVWALSFAYGYARLRFNPLVVLTGAKPEDRLAGNKPIKF